jgi:acyl-CoA thioester hydrolase
METETTSTVRYAETDQMGIVHHSNYAIWYEAGRTDLESFFPCMR